MLAKKKKAPSKLKKYAFNTLIILFSLGAISTGALLLWVANIDVPALNNFNERKVAESTKIYDRTGEILLYDVHGDIKRTAVPLNQIATSTARATIAIEDDGFYEHNGIVPKAIIRAILVNLHLMDGYRGQGGSTITQQVVKNSLLTPEKTISRKIKEWIISIKLEKLLTKDQILEIYLNEAPYGGSIYGVQEASMAFFGKDAINLTVAESAYLASLPQAPTYYSPFGNNRADLEERKNLVLRRMLELGYITQAEHNSALGEEVEFFTQISNGIQAPHFVMYIRQYLEETYGKDAVEQGGLKVTTTLDHELQSKAEEIVKRYALENAQKFNARNAGVVGMDPKTGDILVMVGSRDYFDTDIDGNFNVTLPSNRQPGSAFKPFVYATAFEKGYTPDTVLFDVRTQFSTACDAFGNPLQGATANDCYMPENYDFIYRGPMTLRSALAQSVNVPAVKLIYLTSVADALNTAKRMGITGLADPARYGLTLVLGGGEVSVLDITNSYAIFATEGLKTPARSILQVEDNEGNVLEKKESISSRVLSEKASRMISSVLSDNEARAPAFGERSPLYFPGVDVAVKTGTTNDYRDAWTVGYTTDFVLGAWAGNNDNSSMEKKVAGFIITPMWNEIMQEAIKKYPPQRFTPPPDTDENIKPILRGVWQGGDSYTIDRISGKLATEHTPQETREERFITEIHSILHWVDKRDPLGEKPNIPGRDPQYFLWEPPVQKWAQEKNITSGTSTIPTEYDDIHTPDSLPTVEFISPTPDSTHKDTQRVNVTIQKTEGEYDLSRADVYVNGRFVATALKAPFTVSFIPKDIPGIQSNNTIRVVAYDTVQNKVEITQNFTLSQ